MAKKYVGQGIPMLNAVEKVTGTMCFGADFTLPGVLYGKILRSPISHGRIVKIDTSEARRLPGVAAVIAGPELDLPLFTARGQRIDDDRVMVKDKVHYVGDEIAAVAAVDEETALEAIKLIEVEYSELPALFSPEEAMQPGAPKIHDHLPSNVADHIEYQIGDVEKAFAESDIIVEDEFYTGMVHQAYLEPQSVVAQWECTGKVIIWAPVQVPQSLRYSYARALGIKPEQIRIIQCNVGGGFGAKQECKIHPIAALLSKYSGQPVKIVNTREEEFMATFPRMPMRIHMKIGATKDGTLLAKESRFIGDNGAYTNYGIGIMVSAITRHDNLYRIKNIKTTSDLVYTNKPATNAFRGFGNPQSHFAFESLLDILANKLNMDPAELRLKNATQTGDVTPYGWKIGSCGLSECIEKATAKADWQRKRQEKKAGEVVRGIGLACCLHVSGNRTFLPFFDGAAAFLRIDEEGQVTIQVGEPDIGQGSKTVLAQMAADELGITPDQITVINVDTSSSPHGLGTFGDRVTTLAGNAVKDAAVKAREVIIKYAAEKLNVPKEELEIEDGLIKVRGKSDLRVAFKDISQIASYDRGGGTIQVTGTFVPQDVAVVDPQTKHGNVSCAYPFVAQVAEVEVNKTTGEVKVIYLSAAHDLGKVINPLLAEGQIQGAVAQGIGFALFEDLKLENGSTESNFRKYRIAKATDMPKIDTIFVETDDPNGPYGAKGLAEPALTPIAPAIANAIYNAVGIRLKELPMTPEKVLAALKAENN
jgi:4-hydroxybenzoyl-CoA reductase alpha subunit